MIISLFVPFTTINAHAEGKSLSEAEAINLDQIVSYTDPTPSDYENKVNYYVFETTSAGIYSLNFINVGYGGQTSVQVLDSKYKEIYSSGWLSFSNAESKNVDLTLNKNSVYYVEAETDAYTADDNASAYIFRISRGSYINNVLSVGNDGSSLASPIEIDTDDKISYADPTPEDYINKYRFYTFKTSNNPGSKYNFNFINTNHDGETAAWILDQSYDSLYSSDWLDSSNEGFNIDLTLSPNSRYYIVGETDCYAGDDTASSYQFTVTEKINTQNPGKPIISSLTSGTKQFTVKYGTAAMASQIIKFLISKQVQTTGARFQYPPIL